MPTVGSEAVSPSLQRSLLGKRGLSTFKSRASTWTKRTYLVCGARGCFCQSIKVRGTTCCRTQHLLHRNDCGHMRVSRCSSI